MRYIVDNDLHIHTRLSLCSDDPLQTPERILKYATDNGLSTVCVTDHFWDEYATCHVDSDGFRNGNYHVQNFSHISALNPLPQKDGIRFLFGCETEMDYEMNIGISKQRIDEFDFIVIPTTHLHFSGFTIPSDCVSPRAKAEFWIKKLNALLDKDLPFHKIGIAHLTCGLMDRDRSRFLEMLELIDNEKLAAVLKKAAQRGAGIELNSDDMSFTDSETDTVLRIYRAARDAGCKFYCGSDAHHPQTFDNATAIFNRAVSLLELTEDEKFVLPEN